MNVKLSFCCQQQRVNKQSTIKKGKENKLKLLLRPKHLHTPGDIYRFSWRARHDSGWYKRYQDEWRTRVMKSFYLLNYLYFLCLMELLDRCRWWKVLWGMREKVCDWQNRREHYCQRGMWGEAGTLVVLRKTHKEIQKHTLTDSNIYLSSIIWEGVLHHWISAQQINTIKDSYDQVSVVLLFGTTAQPRVWYLIQRFTKHLLIGNSNKRQKIMICLFNQFLGRTNTVHKSSITKLGD